MARRAGSRHRNGRRSFFWLGYIGAGWARPSFQEVYLYVGKVPVCWSFVVSFLREYTLLRTARAELALKQPYIVASYARTRVTAVVRVLLLRNSFGRRPTAQPHAAHDTAITAPTPNDNDREAPHL